MELNRYRKQMSNMARAFGVMAYVSAVFTVCNVWGVLS